MPDGRVHRPLLVAVTGTNGKTSTTSMLAQLVRAQGHKAVAVGQRVELGARTLSRNVVPRSSRSFAAWLQAFAADGFALVAVEAYSAAIARGAHDHVPFDAFAFTNFAPDHQSVHTNDTAYFAAKMRLFETHEPKRAVLIPRGAAGHARITRALQARGWMARWTDPAPQAPFPDAFMAQNAGLALGLADALGFGQATSETMMTLQAPPGRMMRYDLPNGARAVVDFAHNGHGLRAALSSLRAQTQGRLVLILSSKGGWGAEKRRDLAEAARACADHVIVTDDDPRHEDPAVIRAQLCRHLPGAEVIPARAQAIRRTIAALVQDDTVLIAGRGSDPATVTMMCRHAYNDTQVVEALGGRLMRPVRAHCPAHP